jgi:nucleoside-diphosphate-sugar epimerase
MRQPTMPNNKPKILVMGTTGQVGKGVIPLLTANLNIEVIAAARSPEKAKKIDPIVRLIEALLDFALIAGFLSAIGFLISITSRVLL